MAVSSYLGVEICRPLHCLPGISKRRIYHGFGFVCQVRQTALQFSHRANDEINQVRNVRKLADANV